MSSATPSVQSTIDQGITWALALLRERFETSPNPENHLPFHDVEHTKGVIQRTTSLLKAMGVDDRTLQLGRFSAACHDLVQNWEKNPVQDKILRKRFAGKNETDSAAEGVSWLKQHGHNLFTEADYQILTDAIMATVPGWDPANFTVSQPNLKPDSHPISRAVALSDLGAAGMDGREYASQGDLLFREENLDIAKDFREATSMKDFSEEMQEKYRLRMLGWSKTQPGFAKGRRNRLEEELGNLDEVAKTKIRVLFSHFDEAIQATEKLVAEREKMTFVEIAHSMGYLFPGEKKRSYC